MDPIADLLSTIKNAMAARKEHVSVRYSKIKAEICGILKLKSIISDFEIREEGTHKYIDITVDITGTNLHLKRISKPGRRVYLKAKEIKAPLSGLGFLIVSTPKGIVTGAQAKKFGFGGEVICEVW
jgi:small subunit ribosomal protein S8